MKTSAEQSTRIRPGRPMDEPDEPPGALYPHPLLHPEMRLLRFLLRHRPVTDPRLPRPSAGRWGSTGVDRSFDTLYMGGGTPSVLPADDLEGLIADIRAAFTIAPDAEITVEANPGDIDRASCGDPRAGVNRLNIGVQSFDEAHSPFSAAATRRGRRSRPSSGPRGRLRQHRHRSDLRHPRPIGSAGSRPRGGPRLNPDHLSCYQLTLEEGTPLAERCRSGEITLPGETLQADLFFETSGILEENGYIHYEVSNFARPGRESRHNRKYWNHTPYLGLGPAAHSFEGRRRRWNSRSVDTYISELAAGRHPSRRRRS